MQRYISGESLRKIALEEHRDRATVAKIVKGPEVAEYIEALREKFYGAMEIAMDSLLDELQNPNSKTRGWLSFEMLKAGGVIPHPSHAAELESQRKQLDPDSEDAAVEKIAVAIVKSAIERHRAFGIPLPEADEMEQKMRAERR